MQYPIKFLKRKILSDPSAKLSDVGNYLLLSVGFVVFCFILDMVLIVVTGKIFTDEVTVNINNIDNLFAALVTFCFPSMLCFSVLPVFINRIFRKRNYQEYGLTFIRTKKSNIVKIICLCTFFGCCIVLFQKVELQQAILILFVFIFVGINEEILVRGVLFDILRAKFRPFAAAVVASLIFAFILHSSGGFYENICFRFPLSLLLFWFYWISGDIYSSMLMHMSYNIIVNCL
ncbi:MAG TPA: CPBP family intramembrane glutamic endopeptidase [Lachnospiraceae bacterium]|nr:CPBP family intramembrane glutamic endopeptidase [Lachnospiraceae bacterium]